MTLFYRRGLQTDGGAFTDRGTFSGTTLLGVLFLAQHYCPDHGIRGADKLAAAWEIWYLWNAQLPLIFSPGVDICADEQL